MGDRGGGHGEKHLRQEMRADVPREIESRRNGVALLQCSAAATANLLMAKTQPKVVKGEEEKAKMLRAYVRELLTTLESNPTPGAARKIE